jgi:glucosamine--fructose-6-phosphate aminotransferase (isomerizing)
MDFSQSATATATLMHREAAEAGAAVTRFLAANRTRLAALGEQLRRAPPTVVMTCARGSSDHAATYGKYLLESRARVPVTSLAPSIASVYQARFNDVRGAVVIAISQSGRSPDLLASVQAQQEAGALVVALVNDITSPLALMADMLLPLHAGPERSVAATKTCIVSMAGLAAIVAAWTGDTELSDALDRLPGQLDRAFALDWSPGITTLASAGSLFVIGRGCGFGVAQEMALKLKETCALHAEAFSAAEVRHGPMAIVKRGFPVIALAISDETGASVRQVAAELAARGAQVLIADSVEQGTLPALADHPAIEPILALESFYGMANRLALARGLDPDTPPYLAKVTQTV